MAKNGYMNIVELDITRIDGSKDYTRVLWFQGECDGISNLSSFSDFILVSKEF